MLKALCLARQAAEMGEIPVGAVVVKNDKIISEAHNEVEKNADQTLHAEILAIRRASQKLSNWRLNGCSLYVTLEPCPMCLGAAILSRIDSIYFGAHDERLGAAGSCFDISEHPKLPHQISVFSGIMAKESKELLRKFFEDKRKVS